jgi:hypothetical protein
MARASHVDLVLFELRVDSLLRIRVVREVPERITKDEAYVSWLAYPTSIGTGTDFTQNFS